MGCRQSVPSDSAKGLSSSSFTARNSQHRQSPSVNPDAQDENTGGEVVSPCPNNKVMPWKKKRVFSVNGEESCRSHHSTMSLTADSSLGHVRVNSNALSDWKNELAVDGKLCTAAVRIETEFGRPIEEVYDGVVGEGDILGTGFFGEVRKVTHRVTGVSYAAKRLDIGHLQEGDPNNDGYQCLKDEVFIMCKLDHPNIVRLEEVYETQSYLYLIEELCTGGDLFDKLDEQPDYHYTEVQCARLVKQMLDSVRYLHSKNIIHRDLKLENFLFSSNQPTSELKLIDFGLSKHFFKGQVHKDPKGTPYTVAPEVLRGSYDERCDIWSLGVLTYLLLCGETPFGGADGENLPLVREKILAGPILFQPKKAWDHVSDAGKAFVMRLLNRDLSQRPSAKEAQDDPWINEYARRDTNEGTALSPNIVSSLLEFKEYSDMRKVLCEVLSLTLLPEQIVELRGEFEKMDHDRDGEISLSALKQVFMESAEAGTLGALTEEEVEDIFKALKVRKTEPTIHWHEFIAATLSQCNFDDRNMRLAFDRVDHDRKGFITFDDMKELLGPGADGDDACHAMWRNGVTEGHCPSERITYTDFLRIMKGQNRDTDPSRNNRLSRRRSSASARKSLESNALERVGRSSLVMKRGDSNSTAPTTVSMPITEDDEVQPYGCYTSSSIGCL